jgi:hypothetical protein
MLKALTLLAAGEVTAVVRRQITAFVYFAIAGVIALVASFFALHALAIHLADYFGPVYAYLIIAAGLLAFAGVIAGIGAFVRSRPVRTNPLVAGAALAAPLASRAVAKKSNLGVAAVLAVVVGGALLGRKIGRD